MTKEKHSSNSAASSSGSYPPTSRAEASASSSSHQKPPAGYPMTPKLILQLKSHMIGGEDVKTEIPLTSIKHARQVIAEVKGHTASFIKLFTAEGEGINDDSPVPEDPSKISIVITYWIGNGKLLGKYKHSTDALLSDKCIPVEVFKTAADPTGSEKPFFCSDTLVKTDR